MITSTGSMPYTNRQTPLAKPKAKIGLFKRRSRTTMPNSDMKGDHPKPRRPFKLWWKKTETDTILGLSPSSTISSEDEVTITGEEVEKAVEKEVDKEVEKIPRVASRPSTQVFMLRLRLILKNGLSRHSTNDTLPYADVNILACLPAEMLLDIADCLPTSSAAALTLCNRMIYRKMGSKYFRAINEGATEPYREWFFSIDRAPLLTPEQKERGAFFALLDRDLIDLIYCYYCKKIHDPKKTGSEYLFTEAAKKRACSDVEYRTRHKTYMHEDLYFSKVQMVMKRHRHGIDYSALLNGMAKTCTKYSCHGFTQQMSTLPRIVNNHLYMRTQHWILIPENQEPGKLPEHCFIDLCPHTSTYGGTKYPHKIDELIWCKTLHYKDTSTCSDCAQIVRCAECATEYQVDCKVMEKGRIAIVFMVWQDFGAGVTPFDPIWERHRKNIWPVVRGPKFRAGSLKKAFRISSEMQYKSGTCGRNCG